jgi:hypothetical protein
METEVNRSNRSRDTFAAAALFVFALALRALGLRLGLPYLHHWDEGWITDSVTSMLVNHDARPLSFQYGAPLMRLTVLAYHLARLFIRIAPTDKIALTWLARAVSALISSTGAVACFLAGRSVAARLDAPSPRLRSLQTMSGVAAGLLYATAAELVSHGRYGVTDASYVALVAWTLAMSCLYGERRTLRWAIASVVFAGLALTFKVTALPTLILPLGTLVLVEPAPAAKEWWTRQRLAVARWALVLGAVPIAGAIFLALNPHVATESGRAFHDISGRIAQTHNGGFPAFLLRKPGLPHLAAAVWALVSVVPSRSLLLSLLASAIAAFGLFVLLRRRDRATAVAVAFAVVAVCSMALPNRTFLVRNYLLVVPVIALGFSAGLTARAARFGDRAWLAAAVPLVLLAGSATADAVRNQLLAKDPRVRALDFVAASPEARAGTATVALAPTVAGSSAIAVSHNHVRPFLERPSVRIVGEVTDCARAAASGATYVIVGSTPPDPARLSPYQEGWPFESCPGFHTVARFPTNPYEHNFAVTGNWNGRVSALVLRRD